MRNTAIFILSIILIVIVVFYGACVAFDGDDPPATTTTSAPSTTSTTSTTTPPTTTTFDPISLGTLPPVENLGSPSLNLASSVSTVGIDEVDFGLTVYRAQQRAGTRFTPVTPVNEVCYRATPNEAPDGITFWVVDGTIERVDIDTTDITTRSGAGIGNTENRIREMFGERIVTTPLPDASGNLLAYVPKDESDKSFRIMFVSDGEEIIRFWAGRLPWAEMLDGGC